MGCSRDPDVRLITELRNTGQTEAAYQTAVDILFENANRMAVWREFALAAAAYSRSAGNDDTALQYTVRGGLVCMAMSRHRSGKPGESWLNASRSISAEVSRLTTSTITKLSYQTRNSEYLQNLEDLDRTDNGLSRALSTAEREAQANRQQARSLLEQATVLRLLLDQVPGTTASAELRDQLQLNVSAWMAALNLNPELTGTIISRAESRFQKALDNAVQDLKELGYFLPETIIDNDIL